jgi:hypothetical protein
MPDSALLQVVMCPGCGRQVREFLREMGIDVMEVSVEERRESPRHVRAGCG